MLAYGHVVTMCLKTTYIMPISSDEMLSQFGGNVRNDLNNLLDIDEIPDPDGEIVDLCKTEYIDSNELATYLSEHRNHFNILSLNTQSIRAKFDQLCVILSELYEKELAFSVIRFQESWLKDEDDVSPYILPGYNLINQPAVCSKHGGLMIYVKECLSYKIRSLYKKSNIREDVFIEINSDHFLSQLPLEMFTDRHTTIIVIIALRTLFNNSHQLSTSSVRTIYTQL